MKFMQHREGEFLNIDAIAEIWFSADSKQDSETGSPLHPTKATKQTATIKLLNGSQHMLTGESVELLRREIEGSSIN